jgi:ferredoxin
MTIIARIDERACLAHGDCQAVAPEAFRVADVAVVTGAGTEDQLIAAALACPAGAVLLFDSETGEEIDH